MLAPFVFMENAMKISFYYVDEKYVQYLKDTEISERGFTCIPNMEYHNHDKFVYGVVLSVNDVDYYVPFSHYNRQQEDNILIKVDYHNRLKIAGSLRFNYMFPVPKRCLTPVDFSVFADDRKILLRKEYKACLSSLAKIQKRAQKTYERVTKGNNEVLVKNSCMFRRLEEACKKYTDNPQ